MSQVYVLQLAAQHARWLSERQTIVASNISNADTPGYKAVDIAPFSETLDNQPLAMASTSPLDLSMGQTDAPAVHDVASKSWDQTLSGNTVDLEQQMIEEGDINRSYMLNTNITRVFHQMLLASLK